MPDITININRRPKRRIAAADQQQGGIIRGAKRRRMMPKKKRSTGGINFYDLGQIWNGSTWDDLPFWHLVVDETLGTASPGNWKGIKTKFDLTDAEPFYDLLMTPAFSTWKTYYRKIGYEEAELYGFYITDPNGSYTEGVDLFSVGRNGAFSAYVGHITDSKWQPSGFEKPGALNDKFIIASSICFERFGNTSSYKITTEYDFGAAGVTDFILSANADIYLVPQIINGSARSVQFGTVENNNKILPYEVISRQFWLLKTGDNPYDPMVTNIPALVAGTGSEARKLNLSDWNDIVSRVVADSRGLAYSVDGAGPGLYSVFADSFPDIAVDGFYAAWNSMSNKDLLFGMYPDVSFENYPRNMPNASNIGALVGMIFQNGQLYYFWDNYGGNIPTGILYVNTDL